MEFVLVIIIVVLINGLLVFVLRIFFLIEVVFWLKIKVGIKKRFFSNNSLSFLLVSSIILKYLVNIKVLECWFIGCKCLEEKILMGIINLC